MSPLIRNILADFPFAFSPVDYTWMDLSLYEPASESNNDLLKFTGRSKLTDIPVSDYPLPFENLAVVNYLRPREEEDDQNLSPSVATFDRKGNKLFYKLYLYGVLANKDEPSILATIDGDAKTTIISFGRSYIKMANTSGLTKQELLNDHQKVLAYILRKTLLIGLRPNPIVSVGRPSGDIPKNAKRKRKGKSQFWEWKTIDLKSTVTLPSAPLGGTHASPKPHERMGHWRQYKSGKRVFIKAHIVNKHKIETDGFVFHDYVRH